MMFQRIDRATWPVWAFILSALMLAGAQAFEVFGRMAPCPLCLRQREVYWGAIAIVAIGFLIARMRSPSARTLGVFNIVLGLAFLTGGVIAAYHAGAEWELWPGPTGCSGTIDTQALGAMTIDLEQRFATVSCTEAPWRMLGVSMAGYNALISIGLAATSFLVAARREPLLNLASGSDRGQLSSSTSQ